MDTMKSGNYFMGRVSPTSIRSRILKVSPYLRGQGGGEGFTHVDPFEDTESSSRPGPATRALRFTHVDPFEDTERRPPPAAGGHAATFHPRRSVRGY